jgi:hypothetical protein
MSLNRVRARTITVGFLSRWLIHAAPFTWVGLMVSSVVLAVFVRFFDAPTLLNLELGLLTPIIHVVGLFAALIFDAGAVLLNALVSLFSTVAPTVQSDITRLASAATLPPEMTPEPDLLLRLIETAGAALILVGVPFVLGFLLPYAGFLWYVFFTQPKYISSRVETGAVQGRFLNMFHFPSGLVGKLARMDKDESEPFIVCRNAYHARVAYLHALFPLWNGRWRLIVKLQTERRIAASWGRFNQLNYLVTMAIADALKADWKLMRGEGHLFSDQVTKRDEQKTIVREFNECDMPLRFIQAEPQRRFSRIGSAQLPKPKYVMFSCLFNPIRDPIWILPLKSVLERLKELCASPGAPDYDAAVRVLSTAALSVYGRIIDEPGPEVLKVQFGEIRQVAFLYAEKPGAHLRSGYDENNIIYDPMPPAVAPVLFLFQRAVDEAAKDAICIQLRRGDVLLVKNQEALFARREVSDHFVSWPPTLLPRARWLRAYYLYARLADEEDAIVSKRATLQAVVKQSMSALLRWNATRRTADGADRSDRGQS